MLKITDKDYQLWNYLPLMYIQELSSGRTKPLLMRCICQENKIKDDIVVKINDNVMSNDAKCREIIAAFIAAFIANQLDILVAEPVLVNIDDNTLLAFKDTEHYTKVAQAQGKNFGNKWAGNGYNEFIKGFNLTEEIFFKALHIFIFDVFIMNPDRKFEKQNLKTYQNEIIIFDHESSFAFLFDILPNPSPWNFAEYDKNWIKNHLFYQEIKKNYKNFNVSDNIDAFINVLHKIDYQFWQKTKSLIPTEWQKNHNQIEDIQKRFDLIVQNINNFSNSIKQLFQ